MTRLKIIESFMQEMPCLICLQNDYQVLMYCESPNQVCDHVAECENCGHQALITEIAEGTRVLPPKTRDFAEQQGCLICRDNNLVVDYICDNGSKNFTFFARCPGNEHYMIISDKSIQYLFE